MHKVATRRALDDLQGRKAPAAPAPKESAKPQSAPPSPQPLVDTEARMLIRELSKNVDRVTDLIASQIQAAPAPAADDDAELPPDEKVDPEPAAAEPPMPPRRARILEMLPPYRPMEVVAQPLQVEPAASTSGTYEASIGRDKKGRLSTVTISRGGGAKKMDATVHRDSTGKMDKITITVSQGNP